MSRSIISRYSALGLFLAVALVAAISTRSIAQQQSQDDSQNKHFDVQSSAGDLHLGTDADAKKAGLPLYPGARKRHDDENNSAANLSLFTGAFGVKLVVAKYDSDDAPAKVIDFYREKLKTYGKVLECHTHEHADRKSVV
jgi:hypothetical protein